MGAVRLCARSALRRWVWATIAVTLLVGVAGGVVLAAVAGARRTESAYPRLLEAARTSDVTVIPSGFGARVEPRQLGRLRHVVNVFGVKAFSIADRPKRGGVPSHCCVFAVAPDRAARRNTDRFRVLEGRAPRADRADEVLVNDLLARQRRFSVGDVYRAVVVDPSLFASDPEDLTPAQLEPLVTSVNLRIVGIGRSPNDILVNENQDLSGMLLTPAFARRHEARSAGTGAVVRLGNPERDLASFEAAVRALYPSTDFYFEARLDKVATFARAVSPYADALRLFSLVAGLTGLLVLGQVLVRVVRSDAVDGDELFALGMSRAQRSLASLARAAAIVASGAVVALLVAAASSPLFPLGPARQAEPAPGVRIDAPVLGIGALAIVVLLLAPIGIVAWRRARWAAGSDPQHGSPRTRVAERLARWGASPSTTSGVRFALEHGPSRAEASPTTAVFGLVAAIATIGASLVFAANLDRLVTTPGDYGWRWDAILDTYDSGASAKLITAVRRDDDLSAVTVGTRGTATINGRVIPAFGLDRLRGDARPIVTEGRWPTADHEIALGAQTLRDLNRSVGDSVTGRDSSGRTVPMRIVGRTLLPSLNLDGSYRLGDGAAMNSAALHRLDPNAKPSFFLVDLEANVRIARIDHRYDNASALGPQQPGDIQSYSRVRATPLVLAGLLALLGGAVLAHLLITSVHDRNRDLAILKAIGFKRRQVSATIAWQATTLIGIALMIAIPLGVTAGRWTWLAFADGLGVANSVVAPVGAFIGIAITAVVLGNLIAWIPARTAARTHVGVVLSSE